MTNEEANRSAAEQRLNMGKDPGNAYKDLQEKYQTQQQSNKPSGGCLVVLPLLAMPLIGAGIIRLLA
jgi:hypothetical protein